MTNPSPSIQDQEPTRSIWRSSPYWPGFLTALCVALVGSAIAGHFGLEPLIAPVLSAPKFSAVLLMTFGIYMAAVLIIGTLATARSGEMLGARWSSVWTPIVFALTAAWFLPVREGISPAADTALWVLRLGAGL